MLVSEADDRGIMAECGREGQMAALSKAASIRALPEFRISRAVAAARLLSVQLNSDSTRIKLLFELHRLFDNM